MRAASRIRLQGVIFAALCCGVCALAYADLHVIDGARKSAVFAPFGMSTESLADKVLLKWNATEPSLSNAESAEVLIDDGSRHMRLVMAPGQLASGGLEYSPFTRDVRFRLLAHGRDGRVASESIRVLGSESSGTADRIIPRGRGVRRHTPVEEPGTVRMRVVSVEVHP